MPTVYVVHAPRIARDGAMPDLTPAAKFGSLSTLLEAGEHAAMYPDRAREKIAKRMDRFNPEEDFLMWVGGDPVALMIVSAELCRRGILRYTWLRFSRKKDPATGQRTEVPEYYPVIIDVGPVPPISRALERTM